MTVPLLDLKQQNLEFADEFREVLDRLLTSGQFILGEEVERFENEIAEYIGVDHAIGLSSGTDAILVALMALGIGPGDEVICPSFTFFATAGCVARTGATPVFVDSLPDCFNIDPAAVEAALSPRTKAIVPVHLFGQMAAMEPILKLAENRDIAVIEDAAQAIGSSSHGRPAGSLGCCGAFSFFPTKNLGALGDAGLLATNDAAFADRARSLRNHGMQPKYHHSVIGGNFRIDAIQAAFLRLKLSRLDDYAGQRRANAERYSRHLAQLPGTRMSGTATVDDCRLLLPSTLAEHQHVWNQYTLRVPGEGGRDRLRDFLSSRGIGSEIYYPVPLHLQPCFEDSANSIGKHLATAESLATEVLSLPVFPGLSEEMQDQVIAAIGEFLTPA